MKKTTLCFVLLLGFALQLAAVFHMAGYYPGNGHTGGIAINGNIGYLAVGPEGLRVLDLSDPANPVTVTTVSTSISMNMVKMHGDHIFVLGYIGSYANVLQVFNVTQPQTPVLVSTTNAAFDIKKMVLDDNRLYILHSYQDQWEVSHSQIDIFDITSLSEPELLIHYTLPAYTSSIFIEGSNLFVADDQGLKILDVSNPQTPQFVASYDVDHYVKDIIVRDSLAYLSGIDLSIFDISNPTELVMIGQLPDVWLDSLSICGNTLYGMMMYGYSLRSVDITDPYNPALEGYFFVLGSSTLTTTDGYAYVSHGQRGLYIIDVTDPWDSTLIGNIETEGEAAAVIVDSGIAYVADQSAGLRTFNVTDPTQPFPLGILNTGRRLNDIVKSGDLLYLSSGYWDGEGGLEIIDVADPANPVLIGYLPVQDEAGELVISGNIAYITDNHYGLKIIDVTDPTCPLTIGSYDPPGYHNSLAVSGDIVCLTGSSLCLIDVSNPQHPILRSEFYLSHGSTVSLAGSLAYLTNYEELLLIDISDPDSLVVLGNISPHEVNKLIRCQVQGDRLYTIDNIWHEVLVYDISTPQAPQLIKRYLSNYYTWDVFADGNLLYTTNRETKGIGIHDLSVLAGDDPVLLAPLGIHLDNYPNPFNPETTIRFSLPAVQTVSLDIYNIRGQKVRAVYSGRLSEGIHNLNWDGKDDRGLPVSSGVYLCRLSTPGKALLKRMILMK